jgi:hypothetical protein
MIGEKLTIQGASQENRSIGRFENDECVSRATKQRTLFFRLYPIASYTGVCANGNYERLLQLTVLKRLRHYTKSNYRVGRLRECFGKCPEYYSCKYLELPIYVKTANAKKDEVVWIENNF